MRCLEMCKGKSHEIGFSMTVQGIFNVSLSRAHDDTLFTERIKWLKTVMPKSRENKILTLNTQQRCMDCSSTPCFQLQVTLLVILPLLRGDPKTPRRFKCTRFRKGTLDFSLECIQLLQNDFLKQWYITSNATIPGQHRIYPNTHLCRTFFAGYICIKSMSQVMRKPAFCIYMRKQRHRSATW